MVAEHGYYNNIQLRALNSDSDDAVQVEGLPDNPRLANFSWSPDQMKIAFTHTTLDGVELWYMDLATAKATRISDATLNANMGGPIRWFEDSQNLLVKFLPENRKALIDTKTSIPTGPTISTSDGKKAQNRTYQDLLKNKDDEHNFEQLATATLYTVNLDGTRSKWMDEDIYSGLSFSPDGNYIMVTRVRKPVSYLVPYRRFPSKTDIYTKDAGTCHYTIGITFDRGSAERLHGSQNR